MPIERVSVTRRSKPRVELDLADRFVSVIGSWKFIISQSTAMLFWVCLNTATPIKPDPYPFILLNLMLSTQAALLGPIILMSNNRQGALDRERDENHYLLDMRESEVVEGLAAEVEHIAKRLERSSEEHW